MSRPPKCRRVEHVPHLTYFKPAGVPLCDLEEVCLTVEELESVRLKDYEGLEQEACAEKMGISRPTFHRIVIAARAKIADALVYGKAIRVNGGNFELAMEKIVCSNCNHEWEAPYRHTHKRGKCKGGSEVKQRRDVECPRCREKLADMHSAEKND
ncbi:protein of unknown function DUF134 [Desulfofarcimen acetoxidans DSM 771]|jgi:predicted DNA-binding protein (UPF0251 family)|uniref:UPF0251 protein Dtox_0233 n=1 Tax=Desulfofarcimen acetoxidans (strain ATCC 49208 / DSM 771 / KCTC 5769 / VKM B-1644 / 5575) TaxID=485916 RepID=C8W3T2_DESAS|nr:DUF134 domain-containing protein [Desulfofarcimen acetoxidans]ACV61186.1 protein of unknown function DUF134 [Desulfofarcimen acetoxidans DSM 771]